jgi:hypothetical protein
MATLKRWTTDPFSGAGASHQGLPATAVSRDARDVRLLATDRDALTGGRLYLEVQMAAQRGRPARAQIGVAR